MNKSPIFQWDWQQAGDCGRVTVQVTVGMRTARDLRSMLMDAAYSLSRSDRQTFLCLLFKSGFTSKRLVQEVALFQAVVREDVGRRVLVRALKSPADLTKVLPGSLPAAQWAVLQERVVQALSSKPTTSSRQAVVGMLLRRWIQQRPPVKLSELAALSGASLPTVYAALSLIKPTGLHRDHDRCVSLTEFSAEAWQQWLAMSADRPRAKFVDRSGSPRSPEKLARQLVKLGRQDVAIGGVLGAKHHFDGLDISGAPHLDLVVHGTQHADLSFVEQLDPGLVRDDSPATHGHVLVHFVNRPHSMFEITDGFVWADVLDCMVNLWDSGLTHLVENLINHVTPSGLPGQRGVRGGAI